MTLSCDVFVIIISSFDSSFLIIKTNAKQQMEEDTRSRHDTSGNPTLGENLVKILPSIYSRRDDQDPYKLDSRLPPSIKSTLSCQTLVLR